MIGHDDESSERDGEMATEPTGPDPGNSLHSGRWLVIAMFCFALTMISVMYGYWHLHIGPFAELQRAINAEFPNSMPLVQGGQRKIHKSSPPTLRITMKVDFDPNTDDEACEQMLDRLEALGRQHHDFESYDVFEVHFVLRRPETAGEFRTLEREIRKLGTQHQ